MLILAIETSSKSVSAALLDGSSSILELDSRQNPNCEKIDPPRLNAGSTDELPPGYVKKRSKRGSKTSRVFPPGASVLLAPLLRELFRQTNHGVKDVEMVAVAIGPGSFTGLRVGVVTAKALAYSNQAPIVGVNTLEAIAAQTGRVLEMQEGEFNLERIRPVVNAQRQQLFGGCYAFQEGGGISQIHPSGIIDRDSWIDQIQPNDVLTGPGLLPLVETIRQQKPAAWIAPESTWMCTAESIGKLALRQFESGKRDSLWELEPLYFRPSTAEEIAKAKASGAQL